MKILKAALPLLVLFAWVSSCQKELSYDGSGASIGTLKKDGNGNCLPSTVNGIYKVDTTLTNDNFVDVQVLVTNPGTFSITSDTVNGYSFSKTGGVVIGLNTIRLYAKGKPILAETNTFTVTYGTSQCSFDVTVVGSNTGTAVYTLGNTAGACTGATVAGVYKVGTALDATNTLTVQVNVTTIGTYILGAVTTNGFGFNATGVFTITGIQNVTLNGVGTPTAAANSAVTVSNIASTCTFAVTVLPSGGGTPAVFTLDGSPNACAAPTINGTYTQGNAMAATNTVAIKVNVTTVGTYNISTTAINGVTFALAGTFTATGAQTVLLKGSGTPTAAGLFNFTPNTGTNSCSFPITFLAAAPPAVYTLSGAPNACAPATVNGIYKAATALGATNTVALQVNVSTIGSYSLSTNTVNGFSFIASGIFTATGLQIVTLQGTGTPTIAATNTFTPQVGTSSCTFPVTVGVASTDVFQCKINGVLNTFNDFAEGSYFQPGDLLISGKKLAASFPDQFILSVDKSSSGGTVTAGTYVNTLFGSINGGYFIGANYTDANIMRWSPRSILDPSPDPFTIIITSITSTRVVGTFSGTIRDNVGTGTNTKSITEGVFNLPIN